MPSNKKTFKALSICKTSYPQGGAKNDPRDKAKLKQSWKRFIGQCLMQNFRTFGLTVP